MRPTRIHPVGEKVILDSENPRSSCLAADAATGASWWHGDIESDANDLGRKYLDPLILYPEDLFDEPEIEVNLWGIIDNQDGAGTTIAFGITTTDPAMDPEEHAVQTGVGPNVGGVDYAHRYVWAGSAAGLGLWHWRCNIVLGLAKTLDFNSSTTAWKQMYSSTLLIRPSSVLGAWSAGTLQDVCMGYKDRNWNNGRRITPFFRKEGAIAPRFLCVGGSIRTIPENSRPPLSFGGHYGG